MINLLINLIVCTVALMGVVAIAAAIAVALLVVISDEYATLSQNKN